MEGISGVADAADTMLGAPHYEYCRRLMTAECNAAIAGCFEAGATDVLVNDSHGTMLNLLQEQLDPRGESHPWAAQIPRDDAGNRRQNTGHYVRRLPRCRRPR